MQERDRSGPNTGFVLDAARHNKRLIAALGVVGLLLGTAFMLVAPRTYASTASVLVTPATGNPFAPTDAGEDLLNLETEAEVVQSDAVATRALAQLPSGTSKEALQDSLHVVVPPNTQILEITSTATGPVLAQQRAQAYSLAYLGYRSQQAEDAAAAQLAGIDSQIDRATEDLRAAIAAAAAATSADQQAFQEQLAQALNDEIAELRASRVELQGAAVQPGSVISPAQVPTHAAGLGARLVLLAGLLVGLAGGVALALLRPDHDPRDMLYAVSPGVRMLARGAWFMESLDRFLPQPLADLVRRLIVGADYVVLRAPCVVETPGHAVVSVADYTLLVVVPGVTTRSEIEEAAAKVTGAGRQLLGAVVSPRAPRRLSRRRSRSARAAAASARPRAADGAPASPRATPRPGSP